MVVISYFQDLFKLINNTDVLNLPKHKPNTFKLDYEKSDDINIVYSGQKPLNPFANSETFHASISHWRRLSKADSSCKAVYEVTFDVTNSNFTFKPGDTIGIIPKNNHTEIENVVKLLEINNIMDLYYEITVDSNHTKTKIPAHVPVKATLGHVLTCCVDLRGVVKKAFLLALSRYTKDACEKKVLEYLCSKEGSTAYTTHILNKNIHLLDLLMIFKSCKPPIEIILEHLPRLLPRPYSIVNSALNNANELKICFSVMDIGDNKKGLTTSWLEQSISTISKITSIEDGLKDMTINDTSKIPIYMRKNMTEFGLPEDIKIPLIMIGPGSGVAPFIGFMEEREYLHKNSGLELGFSWLFFGCRDPKLDYIYETELKGFVKEGILNKISTAFSRLDNAKYRYVQDALVHNGKEVTKWILNGAYIYVCGDVNSMAKEIRDIITTCIETHSDTSKEDAEAFIKNMIKEKRYLVDIWS